MSGPNIIRVHTLRPAREYSLLVSEFDALVEQGWEHIIVVGPSYRLTSSIEDWLDFGQSGIIGDEDAITLRANKMSKV